MADVPGIAAKMAQKEAAGHDQAWRSRMRDKARRTPVPARLAPRAIGSHHGPSTATVRFAATRARRAASAPVVRVRVATIPASRLPSATAFRPAGAIRGVSRSNCDGDGVETGSANDRMSLCGLGPEGSSEVGVSVVTFLGFPLLRLNNPNARFALRRAGRVVPR